MTCLGARSTKTAARFPSATRRTLGGYCLIDGGGRPASELLIPFAPVVDPMRVREVQEETERSRHGSAEGSQKVNRLRSSFAARAVTQLTNRVAVLFSRPWK